MLRTNDGVNLTGFWRLYEIHRHIRGRTSHACGEFIYVGRIRHEEGAASLRDAHTASEYWHSIILRGLNSSTYKMALAWCLVKFIETNRPCVTRDELATAFFDLYVDRLPSGMPQINNPKDKTAVEKTMIRFSRGDVDRAAAIAETKSKAFNDVIGAFHMVDRSIVPIRFYSVDYDGTLTLTEDFRLLMIHEGTDHILAEIQEKWSGLELKWKQNKDRYQKRAEARNDK